MGFVNKEFYMKELLHRTFSTGGSVKCVHSPCLILGFKSNTLML